MGERLEKLILFIRGYRKLLVALITIVTTLLLTGISVALLLKAYINGGQFADIIKALASVISTVVVAYMGTNIGKHLLDAGKDCVKDFIEKRK